MSDASKLSNGIFHKYRKIIGQTLNADKFDIKLVNISTSNLTFALQTKDKVYYAKVFANERGDLSVKGKNHLLDTNNRFFMEWMILVSKQYFGLCPHLVLALPKPRIIITDQVEGQGYLSIADTTLEPTYLEGIGAWLHTFHSKQPVKQVETNVLESLFSKSEAISLLSAKEQKKYADQTISSFVFSKSDTQVGNFKLAEFGVVGLDFELCGYRPRFYDFIGVADSVLSVSKINCSEVVGHLLKGYASHKEELEESLIIDLVNVFSEYRKKKETKGNARFSLKNPV